MPVVEETKSIKINANADIVLPHSALILPPRDDAAEYDDTGDTHNFQDDPKYEFLFFNLKYLIIKNLIYFFFWRLVIWRKGNKAVIKLHVIPHENIRESDSQPVIIGFVMQYGYVNTITTLEHKAPQKLDLKVKLYLTIGNIVGNA